MNIEDLPDYPALLQLSRALWREGTVRGAALLVGAGFSKNADRPAADTPEAPLWTDFADSMTQHLYPDDKSKAPRDPLRLAEEYKAYFGRAALDELIRTRINDAAWQPGSLHREILELEWSDVLTTNWDTLLERASDSVSERSYEIVRSESDLAHTRGPRIVKLHGSIGATEHFILTEEDYRTYPTKFAAFVNFARQIFIENELCLVGFSGDDPNFLQWSGWVRDNLGGSARRIYLIGVFDMAPAKRKLLENRNVAPIDLFPLVKDLPDHERNQVAAKLFVEFLLQSKPQLAHDWRPLAISKYDFLPKTAEDQGRLRDPKYAASILDSAGVIWTKDRETYPGWLVCPFEFRNDLEWGTNVLSISEDSLNALSPRRQAEILYEIVWRKKTSLHPIDGALTSMLQRVLTTNEKQYLTKRQYIEIQLFLLKAARTSGNDQLFSELVDSLNTQTSSDLDLIAEVAYQRALRARDQMDFSQMIEQANAITGHDPIWLLRRAALLTEAGEAESAAKFVFEANTELERRQRRDPSSLWIRSRRAWSEWLARATRLNQNRSFDESRWPIEFKSVNCDPWDEIDRIAKSSAAEFRKLREEKSSSIPPFQAGYHRIQPKIYRNHNNSVLELRETLAQLMETIGLPMRLNHVNLVTTTALDAAQVSFEGKALWYTWVLRALDVPWGDVFERYFSRIEIACIPQEEIDQLSECVQRAVFYWRDRMATGNSRERGTAYGGLRLSIEVLARLTVRQSPATAQSRLKLVEIIAQNSWANHPWLNEPLNNLLQNSIASIPISGLNNAILPLLSFPLSQESIRFSHAWPEPFDYLSTVRANRTQDSRWTGAVSRLIDAAAPVSNQRPAAVSRLAYLSQSGALSEVEKKSFGNALWAETESASSLPSKTFLLAYMFAELPAPDGIDKAKLVRDHLFETDVSSLFVIPQPLGDKDIYDKVNHLLAMAAAAHGTVRPTPEQAIKLFDSIIGWRMPDISGMHPFSAGFLRPLHGKAGHLLGDVLRFIVVPSLILEDRTRERAHALMLFIREVGASTASGALPYFLGHDEATDTELIRAIQQAVVGRTPEEVAGAAAAIELWATDQSCAQGKTLPGQLVDRIVSAIEAGRETGLLTMLHCARILIERRMLSDNEKSRMAYTLGEMLAEYQYQEIDPESRQAIIASLVRSKCANIALALSKEGVTDTNVTAWLNEARIDPLPEVRFALELSPDTTLGEETNNAEGRKAF